MNQVADTPGLLLRPDDQRNAIEKLALAILTKTKAVRTNISPILITNHVLTKHMLLDIRRSALLATMLPVSTATNEGLAKVDASVRAMLQSVVLGQNDQ
ncbi:hypothetical protein DYB25_008813 [Aphanomyces astaci]|uniref:Uncharacterized protein n=1 Tax=Aphanomyces astaci TaxID=112090 RepID=A0A397A1J1_APHAT|nr:hypothetical protein DYB25_008813 [Aphanomyces astaci]RHX99558.1 hypothetical protein DYB36_007342 [Aphanomyces astaci]RHZ16971.1 hypothetical protein DYB26_007141 [Aphanomyces astaci]RHZ21913.1 hypothetical protein DYB31_015922 [Aphanomyces astaci]